MVELRGLKGSGNLQANIGQSNLKQSAAPSLRDFGKSTVASMARQAASVSATQARAASTGVRPATPPSLAGSGPSTLQSNLLAAMRAQRTLDEQRQAAAASNEVASIQGVLDQAGLGGIARKAWEFAKQGFTGEGLLFKLSETPEWKNRFSANQTRIKNGLRALTPAEYLSVETGIKSVLRNMGMPAGFYDQPEDIARFIELDVSPEEVQKRAQAAWDAVNTSDPAYLQAFGKYYGLGKEALVAYTLDPQRAMPLLEKQYKAARVGAEMIRAGIDTGTAYVEGLSDAGVNESQARQAAGQAQADMGWVGQENVTEGAQVGAKDLVSANLGLDTGTAERVKGMASQIRGRFAGTGGGTNSLARSSSGQV